MKSLLVIGGKLQAYWALGPWNVARVAWYRLSVKYGFNRAVRLMESFDSGPLFQPATANRDLTTTSNWTTEARLFGWLSIDCRTVPNWFVNHLSGNIASVADKPWYKLPDFDSAQGDIKGLWETSRMEWVAAMAQRAASGNADELNRLEQWLADWCQHNPPYQGVHWKCGQEASIRVMHLAMAKLFLGDTQTTEATKQFLRVHLRRVEPTLSYALAQDNNHGTSEAAAMFIGGSWLALEDSHDAEARRWQAEGRKLLENRANRLIQADGSFSQHSVNYHRLMMDTLNLVEVWRTHHRLAAFSSAYFSKCRAAAHWLRSFVNADSGDAPNIGANDSARLFPVADVSVRDFRATVQIATALFSGRRAFDNSPKIDSALEWYGIRQPNQSASQLASEVFPDGGYAILRSDQTTVVLCLPKYLFRPSHADALHVDIWSGETNVCFDAGTFSYNTDEQTMRYFAGTQSHNTIELDGRDQMPRLGRFLFGRWLRPLTDKSGSSKPKDHTLSDSQFAAAYRDHRGAIHRRWISLDRTDIKVEDSVSGFQKSAVLRWRVPADSRLNDSGLLVCGAMELDVTSDVKVGRRELVTASRSQLYGQQDDCLVLEIEINEPGTLTTLFRMKPVTQRKVAADQTQTSERIHDAHAPNSPSLRVSDRSGRYATH